jgi:pyruvate kinase
LYSRGVNVARLNTAHQTPEATIEVIKAVHAVGEDIAVLVDTKGPEIRTAMKQAAPIPVKKGETVIVRADGKDAETTAEAIQVNYEGFVNDVPVGTSILIDDGYLELVVREKDSEKLTCEVMNDSEIKKKKSVNVPGVPIQLPSVTERDRSFIKMSCANGVDFIAHSFVRNKQDVLDVQEILDAEGSDIKIIAKIENREGVENLDEILEVAYGVMVARGDLGIEIPAEEVPLIQKEMIRKCRKAAKPVITATQMLESMIQNPRATRAEVSDVANAIVDGTDAVMLSGETAYGDYPLEAVETMARIAGHVEARIDAESEQFGEDPNDLQAYIAKSAYRAADELNVDATVVPTRTGSTARQISAYRSKTPVFAACYEKSAVRNLSLSYGVTAYSIDAETRSQVVLNSLSPLTSKGLLKDDSLVSIIMSTPGSPYGETNRLEINTVKACVENLS